MSQTLWINDGVQVWHAYARKVGSNNQTGDKYQAAFIAPSCLTECQYLYIMSCNPPYAMLCNHPILISRVNDQGCEWRADMYNCDKWLKDIIKDVPNIMTHLT